MHRLASFLGIVLVVMMVAAPAFAADEGAFGSVSSAMEADATSVGFDITGKFEKSGGAVAVGEMPAYVDPQQGLVLMISVIAKAGGKLMDRCAVGENYPITVKVNGSDCHTTAGRCKAFLKNPCVEEVDNFWTIPQQSS
ncbi:MAG TPA: hypothetical protein VIU29_00840 [Candidatus Deferrimicrobiaceae bacterium]